MDALDFTLFPDGLFGQNFRSRVSGRPSSLPAMFVRVCLVVPLDAQGANIPDNQERRNFGQRNWVSNNAE